MGQKFSVFSHTGSLVLFTLSGVAAAGEVPTVRFAAEPVIVSEGGQLFGHFQLTKPAPPTDDQRRARILLNEVRNPGSDELRSHLENTLRPGHPHHRIVFWSG